MDPRVENLLKNFLDEEQASKARGFTREALSKSIDTIQQAIQAHTAEDRIAFQHLDEQLRSQRMRIETVETKTSVLDDAVEKNREAIREVKDDFKDRIRDIKDEVDEVTGSHHIPPMSSAPKSDRPSWVRELNRGAIGWIVKSFAIALAGGLGALLHHLMTMGGH